VYFLLLGRKYKDEIQGSFTSFRMTHFVQDDGFKRIGIRLSEFA